MNTLHALRLIGLAGLGSLTALPSFAQDDSYSYLGLGIGQSRAQIADQRIAAGLLANGLTMTSIASDEHDTAYKIFGGYQFNRNIAVELGYFNLGKFGFMANTAPPGTLNGEIKLQGLNLDLVGTIPLSDRWSAIGRIGAQYARAQDSFSGTGAVTVLNPNPRKNETNLKLGAGLQYEISRSMLVRAEAERYRVNDAVGNHAGVNVFSISLVFPFGRAPAVVARAAPAQEYIAPMPTPMPEPARAAAPAPAPAMQIAAAPAAMPAPVRRRVSFSAETLFGFDRSEIRAEGRTALDRFTSELKGTQFDLVIVEGHTDRLGSNAYNMKLSGQRADAVKSYLVSTGGLDGAKVSTVSKGESMPVTKPDDCKGNRPSAALISCLQPDRRVDVEVTGTR